MTDTIFHQIEKLNEHVAHELENQHPFLPNQKLGLLTLMTEEMLDLVEKELKRIEEKKSGRDKKGRE